MIYLDAILEGFLPGPSGEIYTIKHNHLILTDYMIYEGYSHYLERIE